MYIGIKGLQDNISGCLTACCNPSQAIQMSNRKSNASKLSATCVQGFKLLCCSHSQIYMQ